MLVEFAMKRFVEQHVSISESFYSRCKDAMQYTRRPGLTNNPFGQLCLCVFLLDLWLKLSTKDKFKCTLCISFFDMLNVFSFLSNCAVLNISMVNLVVK